MSLNRFGKRYFLLRSSADSDELNDFLNQLGSREIEYETEYKNIGNENEIGILVIVSWGDLI